MPTGNIDIALLRGQRKIATDAQIESRIGVDVDARLIHSGKTTSSIVGRADRAAIIGLGT